MDSSLDGAVVATSLPATTVVGGAAVGRDGALVPRVGVGVLVVKGGSLVLVGRRRSSIGDSTFALPGGHLEFGESWEECAAREVLEETGLVIHKIQFAGVINSVMLNERWTAHYVIIYMRGELSNPEQEPQNLEPDKCDGWEWAEWPLIHQPLFEPLQAFIDSGYKLK